MRFDVRAAVGVGALAFLVVILISIGLCTILIPVVLDTTNSSALNLTGGPAAVVDLIPTLFFFMLVVGGIAGIMIGLGRR